MGLKGIHLAFIVASTLLAVVSAAWCFRQYGETGGAGLLLAGVACVVGGVGLAGYGAWFVKVKIRRLP